MQEIGHNMQTPSISLHLANILKNNWRLPAPPDCPPKVFFIPTAYGVLNLTIHEVMVLSYGCRCTAWWKSAGSTTSRSGHVSPSWETKLKLSCRTSATTSKADGQRRCHHRLRRNPPCRTGGKHQTNTNSETKTEMNRQGAPKVKFIFLKLLSDLQKTKLDRTNQQIA